VESVEPPLEEVRPLEEDAELSEDELSDEELLLVPLSLPELDELVPLLLAVEAAVSESDCIVPTRANTPAAAASVTATAAAAVRRAPLRTAAAAPRSLVFMTVPLRGDVVSRPTVGERSERKL
jgi:hypothetical protein